MEQHRARIEADHNKGIPPSEWEPMEVIIGLFLRENNLRDCAAAYSVKQRELRQWLGLNTQSRRLSFRVYTEACNRRKETILHDTTIRMRIRRGADPQMAASTPLMDKTERAQKAAFARWGDR